MLVFNGRLFLAAAIARAAHDPRGQSARGLPPGESPRAFADEDDQVLDASTQLKRDGQSSATRGGDPRLDPSGATSRARASQTLTRPCPSLTVRPGGKDFGFSVVSVATLPPLKRTWIRVVPSSACLTSVTSSTTWASSRFRSRFGVVWSVHTCLKSAAIAVRCARIRCARTTSSRTTESACRPRSRSSLAASRARNRSFQFASRASATSRLFGSTFMKRRCARSASICAYAEGLRCCGRRGCDGRTMGRAPSRAWRRRRERVRSHAAPNARQPAMSGIGGSIRAP